MSFEENPFKRDERAEMKLFWWRATGVIGLLFWGCIIAAVIWGQR